MAKKTFIAFWSQNSELKLLPPTLEKYLFTYPVLYWLQFATAVADGHRWAQKDLVAFSHLHRWLPLLMTKKQVSFWEVLYLPFTLRKPFCTEKFFHCFVKVICSGLLKRSIQRVMNFTWRAYTIAQTWWKAARIHRHIRVLCKSELQPPPTFLSTPNNFFTCRTPYAPQSMAPKSQFDYQIQLVVVQSQKFEALGCVYVAKDFLPTSLEIWNYLFWTISSLRVEIFNNNQSEESVHFWFGKEQE